MAMEKPETSLWADLPSSLVELILERLPFTDYLRFPAVCLWWRDVQQDHRILHVASPWYQRQMPWMLLSDHQYRKKRIFYNPSERRYYHISLPTNNFHTEVSNHGWLCSGSEAINIFTGSRIPIPSPLETNLHEVVHSIYSVPTNPYCLLLSYVQANRGNSSYYLYRFKDKTWIRLEHPSQISDICEGKFYGLLFNDKIIDRLHAIRMNIGEEVIFLEEIFWVECEGHILLTQIFHTSPDFDKYKIQILKADLSRNVWVRIESLGDNILFLSSQINTNSFSLSAADIGGRGNCIYFWGKIWDKNDNFWDQDEEEILIEYDYETHHAMQRSITDWNSEMSFLGWIVPSLG